MLGVTPTWWGGKANERLGWDRLQALMGTASTQKTSLSIAIKTKGTCGMLFYPAWGQEPACIPAPITRLKASGRWSLQQIPVVRECSQGGIAQRCHALVKELCFSIPGECSGFTDCSLDTASITVSVCGLFHSVKKKKKGVFFSFLEKSIFCSSFCMILWYWVNWASC